MTSAPQSERRRWQDDAHMACRWNVADQARGRIKLDAFRRGPTVADMLREMLEPAFPADGTAS
jgi:hypothetical protein